MSPLNSETAAVADTCHATFQEAKLTHENEKGSALYRAIAAEEWEAAAKALRANPSEAGSWVILQRRGTTTGRDLVWRFLPIHSACAKLPPADFLSELLATYPEGVLSADEEGMLPLHYACGNYASESVLRILLEAYPSAALISDPSGMLPVHHLAKWGPSSSRAFDLVLNANRFVSNARDDSGLTPLDLALEADYAEKDEVVEALINFARPAPRMVVKQAAPQPGPGGKPSAVKINVKSSTDSASVPSFDSTTSVSQTEFTDERDDHCVIGSEEGGSRCNPIQAAYKSTCRPKDCLITDGKISTVPATVEIDREKVSAKKVVMNNVPVTKPSDTVIKVPQLRVKKLEALQAAPKVQNLAGKGHKQHKPMPGSRLWREKAIPSTEDIPSTMPVQIKMISTVHLPTYRPRPKTEISQLVSELKKLQEEVNDLREEKEAHDDFRKHIEEKLARKDAELSSTKDLIGQFKVDLSRALAKSDKTKRAVTNMSKQIVHTSTKILTMQGEMEKQVADFVNIQKHQCQKRLDLLQDMMVSYETHERSVQESKHDGILKAQKNLLKNTDESVEKMMKALNIAK